MSPSFPCSGRDDRGAGDPVPVLGGAAAAVGPARLHVQALPRSPDLQRQRQHLHPRRHRTRQVGDWCDNYFEFSCIPFDTAMTYHCSLVHDT